MTRCAFVLALGVVAWDSPWASAANVSFTMTREKVSLVHVTHGAPLDGDVYKFFATTDADILSVNQVLITSTVPLYQTPPPFGSNTEPPPPPFVALVPSLSVDSWVTTPGPTTQLGPDMPGDGTSTWGDLTNDGPQTHFQFAQLTLPAGAMGNFTARMSVDGSTGPEVFPFSLDMFVPEPTTLALLGAGALSLAALRRRIS